MKLQLFLFSSFIILFSFPGERIHSFFISPTYAQELVSCQDDPVAPPKSTTASFKYEWKASCEINCDTSADCKMNTKDPNVSEKDSNWCYQFADGNKCMQLKTRISKSQKRINSMRDYLSSLEDFDKSASSSDNAKKYNEALDEAKDFIEEAASDGEDCMLEKDRGERDSCKDKLNEEFGKAKAMYRVVKYYSILSGERSETCVEADLGNQPRLNGTSIDQYKEERRLFFCAGKDNSPEKLNIKWRVKGKDGKKLIRATENYSLELDKFPNKEQLKLAEERAGLN